MFPISRDPPEGGTTAMLLGAFPKSGFQFLGIPPKGEQNHRYFLGSLTPLVSNF